MSGEREKKRPLFERLMRFLNVVVILAMIGSYTGGIISPERFWPLAFLAMGYPLILATTLLFLFYWLVKKHWLTYVNIGLILLKWSYVPATINCTVDSNQSEESTVKVMSYNVRLFDRYNWNSENNTQKGIYDLIGSSSPDILCIQEYYGGEQNEEHLSNELEKSGKSYRIHSKNYFAQKKNKRHFGVATITSYPVINEGTVVLENSRDALTIFTDILIKKDTVRVYNIHLQSLLLGRDGYRVLNELIEKQEIQKVDDGRLMISRLKSGFIKRAAQADKISLHIRSCPYSIILCGDFNDVPFSYAFQQLKLDLKDSFAEAGNGTGFTYVPVPFFRIDNILVSENFEVLSHVTHNEKALSDHYAISASIEVKD